MTGETPDSSVASRASFSASSVVRRLKLPAPRLTLPIWLALGVITSMFVPRDLMFASICALAPSPMATMTITAPTPMMMPSIVRSERILVRRRLRAGDAEQTADPHAVPPGLGPSCSTRPSRRATSRGA